MDLTPDQDRAAAGIRHLLTAGRGRQTIYLGGYAGTGKTTIARLLAADFTTAFCAFTGKAASVMRRKGCEGATTIHSLIYNVEKIRGETNFVKKPELEDAPDLIVVDECSMVDGKLGRDLESFGIPVLAIGDPAQLPPVGDSAGYFTAREPDFMLTEVHRQALESGVLRLANDIRAGKPIASSYGDDVEWFAGEPARLLEADQILCGKSDTRVGVNMFVRKQRGIVEKPGEIVPQAGEKLVCLRNDHRRGLLNGSLWRVDACTPPVKMFGVNTRDTMLADVTPDDGGFAMSVQIRTDCLHRRSRELPARELGGDCFDFGYALTVHKSQGSEWDTVAIIDEKHVFGVDARAWIYTAITRASKKVMLTR